MDRTFWQKQTNDQPLFPDLLWSRPENKRHAGKLLVIGGNLHGFSAPAAAYTAANQAGVGTCRVILPDSLEKTVSKLFPAADYASSTSVSGAFGRAALERWTSESDWADGVLLAGDLGRNSETAIVLEGYLQNYDGQLTLVNDAVDYCLTDSANCLDRPETTLVLTMGQLQKLGTAARSPTAFTSDMALLQLVEILRDFSQQQAANLVVRHTDQLLVAIQGRVSSTVRTAPSLTDIAAGAAVWWLQNPARSYEALTTALLERAI